MLVPTYQVFFIGYIFLMKTLTKSKQCLNCNNLLQDLNSLVVLNLPLLTLLHLTNKELQYIYFLFFLVDSSVF